MKKVSLIGAGQIGGTIAYMLAAEKGLSIILHDRLGDVAKGKAMDIKHAYGCDIIGTNEYSAIEASDVIVITAGSPRKPGMSRDDLLSINVSVIKEVADSVKKYSPNAFVIIVTNPLDAITQVFLDNSEMPSNKIVGMSVLDTYRLRANISEILNIKYKDINGVVIGSHGDTMVPLLRYSTIAGIPFLDYIKISNIDHSVINDIIEKTKFGGQTIVKLFGNGSAYYAPAKSCFDMIMSYLCNEHSIMPACVSLNGQYGVDNLCMCTPIIIGSNGVERIIELPLLDNEKQLLKESIKSINDLVVAARKF